MNRGGKRPGSGRKKRTTPLIALTMRLQPEIGRAWIERKQREKLSGPALLAKLLSVKK